MSKFDHKQIEEKWKKVWKEKHVYKTPDIPSPLSSPNDGRGNSKKMYILDMFPYPSGAGLHVGHVEGYTATDVVSRYNRMLGKDVLHPMGWDAFGLPAENYAIKTGLPPRINTDNAIEMFKKQIDAVGLSYDWDRELGSHRPDYYKWTQWFFIQLYKKGLAYKKEAPVNWCPKDQTVLANEQVIDGICERCDTPVIQKNMSQWFFKITDYADRLIDGLKDVDWPESTKINQINWIGKSDGMLFTSPVKDMDLTIQTFSAHFEAFHADTFIVIAPDHPLLPKLLEGNPDKEDILKRAAIMFEQQQQTRNEAIKDYEGIFIGRYTIDPIGNGELPIWIANYALSQYGTGIVKCSAHDERDFAFAKKYNIPLKTVLYPKDSELTEKIKKQEVCFSDFDKGYLTEPVNFGDKPAKELRQEVIKYLVENKLAEPIVKYKLRDWLVSRQRFWGAPIPIVYDPEGNAHLVDEEDLPVILPDDIEFLPTGESPLKYHKEFHERVEKKYGKGWKPEVDTMDTFVDSSWYFFRFADPNNLKEFASKEAMNKWNPVDIYVGGAEHTVLHLMYARFFTKFLFDEGYINYQEPFINLRHPGTILGEDNRKMSKRWGNVINPLDVIDELGADALRMYEMFMGPFDQMKPWSTTTIKGVRRFLDRVYDLPTLINENKNQKVEIALNKLIKSVTEDLKDFKFNTVVSEFMKFVNLLEDEKTITQDQWKKFLLGLAPLAPFITEDLWEKSGEKESIHLQSWPEFDEALTKDASVIIAVQINGKVRGQIEVTEDDSEESVKQKALAQESVIKWIDNHEIKKFIYIKSKIVNIVI